MGYEKLGNWETAKPQHKNSPRLLKNIIQGHVRIIQDLGSHSSDHEEFHLLRHNAVYTGESLSTFRSNTACIFKVTRMTQT
jgi:hypothetical protein